MRDVELIIFNAGRRLFDDASEPVSRLIHDDIWPGVWLTVPERDAAEKLSTAARWKWFRQGWHEAMVRDAQPDDTR